MKYLLLVILLFPPISLAKKGPCMETRQVMQSLYHLIGNKLYMREVEQSLNRIDLSPQEKQAFLYLARDLEQEHIKQMKLENNKRRGL